MPSTNWCVSNLKVAIYEVVRIAEQVTLRQLIPIVGVFAELPLNFKGQVRLLQKLWEDQVVKHVDLNSLCSTMQICSIEDGDQADVLFEFCQAILLREFQLVQDLPNYKKIINDDPDLDRRMKFLYSDWQIAEDKTEAFVTGQEVFDFWFEFFEHTRTHNPARAEM